MAPFASLAASWTHELGANGRAMRPVALDGASWETGSSNIARDGAEVDAGLSFKPTAATQIKLGYSRLVVGNMVSDKGLITAVLAW